MEKTTENITNSLLKEISGKEIKDFKGAYNIRVDCGSIARQSSENIKIETKKDNPQKKMHAYKLMKKNFLYHLQII